MIYPVEIILIIGSNLYRLRRVRIYRPWKLVAIVVPNQTAYAEKLVKANEHRLSSS